MHPNITMHILHTVLNTFPKVLTRRICLTIISFYHWWLFPFFLVTFMCDLGVILKGEIRCSSFLGVKWLTVASCHLFSMRTGSCIWVFSAHSPPPPCYTISSLIYKILLKLLDSPHSWDEKTENKLCCSFQVKVVAEVLLLTWNEEVHFEQQHISVESFELFW